jgi:hypothetical protein
MFSFRLIAERYGTRYAAFMGAMKTILLSIVVLGASQAAASPPAQLSPAPHDRARIFAECAGWLLALEEHQRLFDGARSELTATHRAAFLDLLDAVLPDAEAQGLPAGTAMSWRVVARAEQGALLGRAAFAGDAWAREPARSAATARVDGCLRLLPGV